MIQIVKQIKNTICDVIKNTLHNAHKGFTLIELMVVVLIIGILAGIALPQYQLAIDKSKFAKYRTFAKNLADAYWRYIYVYSTPPNDIEELDIDLPFEYTKTSPYQGSCAVFDDMYCCILHPTSVYQNGGISCGNAEHTIAASITLLVNSNDVLPQNYLSDRCAAKTDNKRAIRLCESMNYTLKLNANLPTQYGHKLGYTFYYLK